MASISSGVHIDRSLTGRLHLHSVSNQIPESKMLFQAFPIPGNGEPDLFPRFFLKDVHDGWKSDIGGGNDT